MSEKPLKRTPKAPRQSLPVMEPEQRIKGCEEVALGFTASQAVAEALRCLNCVDPKCVEACPLRLPIKTFIDELAHGEFDAAFAEISKSSVFPGICGRVCQHELFCEKVCLLGKKLLPVAIGSLERFVADYARAAGVTDPPLNVTPNGLNVALVGSGPASLITAFDLAKRGYRVTIFEALHQLGGVLAYGIPPFRLPRNILRGEIERLRNLGVEFRTDFLVGRTAGVNELFEQGYAAIFLGTGAGLPHLMGIPGENLVGVYTANEFLTRLNLMEAFREEADTPVFVGKHTVVVGGGNSAMDAARWAKRMGSETTILFRRGRAELRARLEEIEHAEEEGIHFEFLAAPVRLIGDDTGVLREMECIRMQLGEPDDSGRPSPVPLPGSEYRVRVETVVMAIGQSPNPTVQRATPQLITRRGKVVIDGSGKTSMSGVYAGGDVVRGGSTVILAMADGRAAAAAIDASLREQYHIGEREAAEPEEAVVKVHFLSGDGEEVASSRETVKLAGKGAKPASPVLGAPDDFVETGFPIVRKRMLSADVAWLEVKAPEIAAHWKPGQFIIERPTPQSERIPLTLVDGDARRGTITLVVQAIGKTSRITAELQEGDRLSDLLGPLGSPASIAKLGHVICVAGGVGVAELLPVARAFRQAGNRVTALCGARTASLILLNEELREVADDVFWATDDGSGGLHGNVVQLMRWWRARQDNPPDAAHVIGPIPMMRFAAAETKLWGVKTWASLNPIMVDGTGMCGGCRVTVGGKVMFACVDGPEFDAHGVDFEELTRRNRAYTAKERRKLEQHVCQVGLGR